MGAIPHDQKMVGTRDYVVHPSDLSQALPEAIRLRMVRLALETFGLCAAGQLWFTLGLPIVPAMRVPPAQSDLFP